MKICTYNILEGGLGRIDPLAEVIRLAQADAVVVQECWDEALFSKLAQRLGMEFFRAENPQNNEGATGLLTRWEIREAVNHAPLDHRLSRSAFHAVLREKSSGPPHTDWTLVGLHLHARETLADEEIRLQELPAILEIANRFCNTPNLLLCGDFNTSHPDQIIELSKLRPKVRDRIAPQGNLLPREVIRRVLATGWIDAHTIRRAPTDFHTSFTTSAPAMRVDFIFVPPSLAPRVRSCEVFKPEIARFASDHFPVVAEILPE